MNWVLFVHVSSFELWRGDGGGGGGGVISIKLFKAGEVLRVLTRKQIECFCTWFITTAVLRSILTLRVAEYCVNSASLTVFRHVVLWIMSGATDPYFVVVDT
jgi:hypothetical protein